MYQCPSCGGQLYFSIRDQRLRCPSCDNLYDPEKIDEGKGAKEEEYYGVTIYTCTQCGAEIVSTDHAATAFCSYCGSQTTLEGRLGKEVRPKYIVPFQKTKVSCKEQYAQVLSYAAYAPKELHDPQFIENFRGIYMPYWLYRVHFKDEVTLPAERKRSKGEYEYTDEYSLTAGLQGAYENIQYDASSSFDDNIAAQIAPFTTKHRKPFKPAYLAGFFADTADVDKDTYRQDAEDRAGEYAVDKLARDMKRNHYEIEKPSSKEELGELLGTKCDEAEAALLPVWFLTWRKGKRVAYAIVNGETGKVSADIPVDPKRFALGTLAVAALLFVISHFLVAMTAKTALSLAAVLAALAQVLFFYEMRTIMRKENHLDDKGFFSQSEHARARKLQEEDAERIRRKDKRRMPELSGFPSSLVFFGIMILFSQGVITLLIQGLVRIASNFGLITAAAVSLAFMIRCLLLIPKVDEKSMLVPAVTPFLAVAIAFFMRWWNPVADWYYYIAAACCLAGVLVTCVALIRRYNLIATRPVPDFFRREGGNSRAN